MARNISPIVKWTRSMTPLLLGLRIVVAIGKYVEESIITTLNCKEAGVNFVAAKASTEIHGKLLKKVGADLVVFPEYDAGCELAHRLTRPSILERFDLDPEHSIVELKVPEFSP